MKNYILILFFSCMYIMSFGQDRSDKFKEKIESRRIAFLSDKLDLTPSEAQDFWPVYNAFKEELSKCRLDKKHLTSDALSNEQSDGILEEYISKEQNAVNIKKSYIPKMKSILGSKRTLKVFVLDRKFKESMMKELNDKRQERRARRKN